MNEIKKGMLVIVRRPLEKTITGGGWSLTVKIDTGAIFRVFAVDSKREHLAITVFSSETGEAVFTFWVPFNAVDVSAD